MLKRDEFGVVPLYCYFDAKGRRLLHGSSVRELLGQGVPRKLSREGLFSYLSYGFVYAPLTLIDGVSMVPPGCEAVVDGDGRVSSRRYWNPSFEVKKWTLADAQAAVTRANQLSAHVC